MLIIPESHFGKTAVGENSIGISRYIHEAEGNAIPHSHDFFEFAYVVRGSAVHVIDGRRMSVSAGDYFAINIGTFHMYIGDIEVINCMFYPELIDKSLKMHTDFRDILSSYLLRSSDLVLSDSPTETIFNDSDKIILGMFEKMYTEYQSKDTGYEEILRASLIELIIRTLRKICVSRSQNISPMIKECLAYIDRNITSEISLAAFCGNQYYNLSYVSRKFKNEIGIPFSQYVQQVRIKEACRLLVNTSMNISEIQEVLTYHDNKYFNELFFKQMKLSPREYRKLNQ